MRAGSDGVDAEMRQRVAWSDRGQVHTFGPTHHASQASPRLVGFVRGSVTHQKLWHGVCTCEALCHNIIREPDCKPVAAPSARGMAEVVDPKRAVGRLQVQLRWPGMRWPFYQRGIRAG